MENMKAPGAYIVEKNAFANSVVEVATAVPAFIGYTEQAMNQGVDLTNRPWRISSMAQYHQFFGYGPVANYVRFSLAPVPPSPPAATTAPAATPAPTPTMDTTEPLVARDATALNVGGSKHMLKQIDGRYLLYYAMLHFFQNGGGPCYVVSVGPYAHNGKANPDLFRQALDQLTKELEPTMIVMPEAVTMKGGECYPLQRQAIMHCGTVMRNRVAILDVWEGYRDLQDPLKVLDVFRDNLGSDTLAYATAYYPWMNAEVVQDRDLTYLNLDDAGRSVLADAIKKESADALFGAKGKNDPPAMSKAPSNVADADKAAQVRYSAITKELDKLKTATDPTEQRLLADTLATASPFYNSIITEMAKRLNVLPPSAAMAGIYTMVDNASGVWKAPANVRLNGVLSPTVPISSEQQEDLDVAPQGKSINVIRTFEGEGTLVWGARTLDGNSPHWCYINVRRTLIMLEESIRLAAKAMVFEPNVANTWAAAKRMICDFLTSIWKRGGLAGATPDEAFGVFCGLGETMTPDDILEGIMRVSVRVALSRPAEFIEITLQQQMQKS